MIRSVYEKQDDILNAIIQLHCPSGFECDLTYGNGSFWKNIKEPAVCLDIEPLKPHVINSDSANTPLADKSLNNVVFDPPFLTYVKNGRAHKGGGVAMTARFGGYYRYDELETHYKGTLKECARILNKKGIMVFKCMDIIHNHKMHSTHHNVINWAAEDFRLKDMFILVAKSKMAGPQKGQQRHARIFHSYFLVFEKTGK